VDNSVTINGCRLYHGCSSEILKTLPSESVDAVVTDPPFGIGFDYDGKKEEHNNPSGYWAWLEPIYQEWMRILKPGGFMAVWNAQANFRYFWDWFGDDIHIYIGAKNFVQIRKVPINYGYEPVIMKYKIGAPPKSTINAERSIDYYVANTAAMVSDTKRIERNHPCPRAIDLTIEIVKNFTLDGGLILDPFMGSATTGIACIKTGRSFIGIEKDKRYYELSCKRIGLEKSKQTLLEGW